MLDTLLETLAAQSLIDWTILVTAIVYIVLAAWENAWCWAWGIVSCGLWAYVDFAQYNLWVDGILQLFYVAMGFWGIYAWKFSAAQQRELGISTMTNRQHAVVIASGVGFTILFGFIFDRYSPTALPYQDSFITAFSILATVLTVQKKLENWIYWIVVDLLAIFLFATRGAVLEAVVMAVYTPIAIAGYFHWQKQLRSLAQPS